jgi:hypothetical protein
MELHISVAYYNDGGDAKKDAHAIVTLDPKIQWTSQGNDVSITSELLSNRKNSFRETTNRYRYGVRIIFETGQGAISMFDWPTLISNIVQSIVLFSTVAVFVSYVAQYCCGVPSKMYHAAIREELSFSREVARFTCQALIARTTFEHIDSSDNGSISKAEMQSTLTRTLFPWMSDVEVGDLAQMVVEDIFNAKQSTAASSFKNKAELSDKEMQKEQNIGVFDFLELGTEQRFNFESLKTTIARYHKEAVAKAGDDTRIGAPEGEVQLARETKKEKPGACW